MPVVRFEGRMVNLPEVMGFEGQLGRVCFWTFVRFGEPEAGEYFASGAKPFGYLATQRIPTKHIVVKPTFHAMTLNGYTKGDPVS